MGREETKRKKQAKLLRVVRKIHRYTGVASFLFFFIIGVTGVLLGWKKNTGGVLLPKTQKGITTDLKKWLPLDSLHSIANNRFKKTHNNAPLKLDRLDVRPEKGIVKFVYVYDYTEIQIDAATGIVFHVRTRYSDMLENIHDGSIVDRLLGIKGGWYKLFYTTLMGLALISFTITGFWLWYGPKRMRK